MSVKIHRHTGPILVIMLRQIGDVVLTTPIPHILKRHDPSCEVHFLVEEPCDQLLRNNPDIDKIIISTRKGGVLKTLATARLLRRQRYSMVLDFMANPRSALISFLSGTKKRISFDVKGRGVLYTQRVDSSGDDYAIEVKKKILRAIGIEDEWDLPRVYLTDEEKTWAGEVREKALDGAKYLATVDPGHKDPRRQWPAQRYGELCKYLLDKHSIRALLIRGPNEEEDAQEVVAASGGAAYLPEPTTLRQMAALIDTADVQIGNCSAPRHIAVGLEKPTFTIIGSSTHVWTHPDDIHVHASKGMECQPCKGRKETCHFDYGCMATLGFEEVVEKLDQWLAGVMPVDKAD